VPYDDPRTIAIIDVTVSKTTRTPCYDYERRGHAKDVPATEVRFSNKYSGPTPRKSVKRKRESVVINVRGRILLKWDEGHYIDIIISRPRVLTKMSSTRFTYVFNNTRPFV